MVDHMYPAGTRTLRIGNGQIVPYPLPTSPAATAKAKANQSADTKPEARLRSALHRSGLRFRKDVLIRTGTLRTRPDVLFTRARVAVYVDGCFWHGCAEHQRLPKSNIDYWGPKLAANMDRDRRIDSALENAGWQVLRIWEHETIEASVGAVVARLAQEREDERSLRPPIAARSPRTT